MKKVTFASDDTVADLKEKCKEAFPAEMKKAQSGFSQRVATYSGERAFFTEHSDAKQVKTALVGIKRIADAFFKAEERKAVEAEAPKTKAPSQSLGG